jgi:hypothetical protein
MLNVPDALESPKPTSKRRVTEAKRLTKEELERVAEEEVQVMSRL